MKKLVAPFLILFVLVLPLTAQAAVQQVKSSKGITAWLVEDQSLPIISISFAWRFGLERDPDGKEGLSYLAASMLTQGAGDDDANVFQKKLEDNAITLGFDGSRDVISGSMRSLKDSFPLAVKMLRSAVQSPRFAEDDLARQKAQMINSLNMYRADTGWLLSRLAFNDLFTGHPYGKRTLGNEATIGAITPADLKAWHARLDRAHLVVAVTGAITPTELKTVLDQVFGSLPAKTTLAAIPEYNYQAPATTSLLRHAGTQSEIMFTWAGFSRRDPDWYATEVMNYIFGGGGFSSRLTEAVREKRGLTYGISSGMLDYKHAALYMVQGSAKNENISEVIRLVKEEATRIVTDKISAEELQEAKDYLIGAYPLQMTSTARIASHYRGLQLQDLPVNEQEKRAAAIRAVTVDDVQRVAARLMKENPAIFLVGEPTGITADKTLDKID